MELLYRIIKCKDYEPNILIFLQLCKFLSAYFVVNQRFINYSAAPIYKKDSELGIEQFPFGNIKHLRLSMQLNNLDWTGEVNPLELPAEMTIDWVKFYEKKDPSIPDY
jgi:hypothetical protein